MHRVQDVQDVQDLKNDLEHLKINLCLAKSKLDNILCVDQITAALDPFKKEKYKISKKIGEKHISNAWLKCFNIIMKFGLLHRKPFIRHYDNAAFPGAFILATKYVIKTYNSSCDYNWRACSLYDAEKMHLNDDYKLYEKFPDKWLMDSKNNGDITNLENINDIAAKLLDKTNFYTSDLGFDVSSDYNNQERLHFCANTGQILLCLKILQGDGCCIIKHYTYFEEYTIKYLSEFSKLFKKFYFYKPPASKALNSEIYLVGIDFIRQCPKLEETYKNLVYNLEHCLIHEIYNLDYKFPLSFMKSIWIMTKNRVNRQIDELRKVMMILQEVQYNRHKDHTLYDLKREIFLSSKKYRNIPKILYDGNNNLLDFYLINSN